MRVAFAPSAPFLLLGSGPVELRSALDGALAALTGEVVVVGAAPTAGWVEGSVDLTPYGVVGPPRPDPLPLPLAVGRTLLAGRPHRLWGVPGAGLPEAADLLVVGDGTAKRSVKAPGHLDGRAAAYDEAVVDALASGSPEALRDLDEELGAQLWVSGIPAWKAVAGLPGPWRASLAYSDAPYGVGYVVATWQQD